MYLPYGHGMVNYVTCKSQMINVASLGIDAASIVCHTELHRQ